MSKGNRHSTHRPTSTHTHISPFRVSDSEELSISISALLNMKQLHVAINFKWPIRIRTEYLNMWPVIRLWDKCGENSAQSIRKLHFSLSFNHNQVDPSQPPHSIFDVKSSHQVELQCNINVSHNIVLRVTQDDINKWL